MLCVPSLHEGSNILLYPNHSFTAVYTQLLLAMSTCYTAKAADANLRLPRIIC